MRWWRCGLVLVLIGVLLGEVQGQTARVGAVGVWTPAASPPAAPGVARTLAVTLADGRVLMTRFGVGAADPRRDIVADLYDPATDRWTSAESPDRTQGFGAPVVLPDGQVLLSGGGDPYAVTTGSEPATAQAQRYDPAANRWTPVAPLGEARDQHTATLLKDGSVLVVGGEVGAVSAPRRTLASAERFDPRTGHWSAAGRLAAPRSGHTATLLPDGRVLVVGGGVNIQGNIPTEEVLSAELYDPARNRWSLAAAPLRTHGAEHTATLLTDGRVLVVGGHLARPGNAGYSASVEAYDPAKDSWTLVAPLRQGRYGHAAVLLPGGRVLVIGESYSFSELYDPARDLWVPEARVPETYAGAITPLLDGRVFLASWNRAAIYRGEPADGTCFAETGKCVRGRFFQYWQEHGGLAINGYPIGDEQVEILEDGRPYTVQYFERSRLEYHAENESPNEVLLGQFGRRMLSAAYAGYLNYPGYQEAIAPAAPLPEGRYFHETGHNLGGRFLAYWEAHGGLAQFGYPITEERWDGLPGGAGFCCQTQYFERARFEYHPENAGTPYEVLLGQFGRQFQQDNTLLLGSLGRLYFSEAGVRERLGAPRGPAQSGPGTMQSFQRGQMFWRGDQHAIYVLVGTPQRGTLTLPLSQGLAWPDTWAEGQDPGGGPAPIAGLYYPQRGFGKLWREQQLRDYLGYATTPGEYGYTITVQEFVAGLLFTAETPTERFIYAVYLRATGSHGMTRITTYERFEER